MEGGGVKGIGLVGALSVLASKGYAFRRIAGTSAGAIAGSLLAAGMDPATMRKKLQSLDYAKFRDKDFLDDLGLPGKALALWFEQGVYKGDYLREWLSEELRQRGVETFGDLKLTSGWAEDVPAAQRYKLVVLAADVTRGRLVRLPWDYKLYGLEPDSQKVADAVRASMSLPFFYRPVHLDDSMLVDRALISNFPIDLFDSTPQWPTFGIKLSAKPGAWAPVNNVKTTVGLARAVLDTMANAHDRMHLDDPDTLKRTIFVDTLDIKVTDFDITSAQQEALYKNGQHGAEKFLQTWSFAKYKKS